MPKKKINKCEVCSKVFREKYLLDVHIQTHADVAQYACTQCDYKCKVKKYLSRHVMRVHKKTRNYECDECGKKFCFPGRLAEHKWIHTGEKPYECDECDKSFNSRYSLNTHKFIHSGEKPYQCSYCKYSCRDCSTLRKHEARHNDQVPLYRCKICNNTKKSKWQLKMHVAEKHLNLDVRKFFCDICGKGFKMKNVLSTHMQQVHLKTMMATCKVCGVKIATYHNMSTHMMRHVDHKPFSCTYEGCQNSYKAKGDLAKHMLLHNPDKLMKCNICEKGFNTKYKLKRHFMGVHYFQDDEKCKECGAKFSNKSCLNRHIRKQHSSAGKRRYMCDSCDFVTRKKSKMVKHLRRGHGLDIRECKQCEMKFAEHKDYRVHMRNVHGVTFETFESEQDIITIIKEEVEEDEVSIDLFEVEKEEVLEDNLPEEIQATIQTAIESEMYDLTGSYTRNLEGDKRMETDEFHTNTIQNHNNKQPPMVHIIDRNVEQSYSDLCNVQLDAIQNDANPIQEMSHRSSIYNKINLKKAQDKSGPMPNDTEIIQNIDTNTNYIEDNDLDHTNPVLNSDHSSNQQRDSDAIQNKEHTESTQNVISENSVQNHTNPVNDQDLSSSQNSLDYINLQQNENQIESLQNSIETNTLEQSQNKEKDDIKDLIYQNIKRVKSISEQVYDEHFIDRIVKHPKDYAKKPDKCENIKLKDQAAKDIKKLVVEAKRMEIANALEKTRQIYNERMMRALGVVNKKEKIKIKYFNKNKKSNEAAELTLSSDDEKTSDTNENSERQNENNENNEKNDNKNNDDTNRDDEKRSANSEGTSSQNSSEEVGDEEDNNYKNNDTGNKKHKLKLNTHQCYVCFQLYKTKEELLDHCKKHFAVVATTSLKICPLCAYVTKINLTRHLKVVHDLKIKVPYGKIHDQTVNDNVSRYYYEVENSEIDKIEVIPSLKNLNKMASTKIDKMNREIKNKTVAKTKLVKKGKEWIVEKEKIEFDESFLLPKFDIKDISISEKKIKVNADEKETFSYIENLKRLYQIAKKKGHKMMFPCNSCDKVCQAMSALKLHKRKHDPNKKPFKKKVWKHKLKDNAVKRKDNRKRRKNRVNKTKKDIIEKTAGKSSIEGSQRSNIKRNDRRKHESVSEDGKVNEKQRLGTASCEINPKPVTNNHRCDPQLIEFYNNNIKGSNIEFWQFLKIFNKMDRENVTDFSDLKERNDLHFGIHYDDDVDSKIEEDADSDNTSKSKAVINTPTTSKATKFNTTKTVVGNISTKTSVKTNSNMTTSKIWNKVPKNEEKSTNYLNKNKIRVLRLSKRENARRLALKKLLREKNANQISE